LNDRPYIRKSSPGPPPPDGESVSIGVHCFRWTKRCGEPRRLREARAALKALLAGETAAKGGDL
jgi:hypothetical protein